MNFAGAEIEREPAARAERVADAKNAHVCIQRQPGAEGIKKIGLVNSLGFVLYIRGVAESK